MDTMKCMIDGSEVNRQIDHYENDEQLQAFGVPPRTRAVPVLQAGEEIFWVMGDSRPQIVKTHGAV